MDILSVFKRKPKIIAKCLAGLAIALRGDDRATMTKILSEIVKCDRCPNTFQLSQHCTQEGNWYFKFTCPKCGYETGLRSK